MSWSIENLTKRCFKCNRLKPLFLFSKNRRNYQLKSDKGRLVNCRLCETIHFMHEKGKVVRYDFVSKKFNINKGLYNVNTILQTYFL